MAEPPIKPGPVTLHGGTGAPDPEDEERTRVGGAAPVAPSSQLTGGPAREYRSGEIEPSKVSQVSSIESDWEEKTVVDDGQLYTPPDKPTATNTALGLPPEEDHTLDEPRKPVSPPPPQPLSAKTITYQAASARAAQPTPARAPQPPGPTGPAQPPAPSPRPAPQPESVPLPSPSQGATPSPPAPVEESVPPAAHGKLVVISGNDSGREFPLTGKTITVGRGIDNDVVLTDIAVSRKHLSLSFDGAVYHLTDKGSGNGTVVNQRVETGTCKVAHGDRIEIGNTVFRFEHPASESAEGTQQEPSVADPSPTEGFVGLAPSRPSPPLPAPFSSAEPSEAAPFPQTPSPQTPSPQAQPPQAQPPQAQPPQAQPPQALDIPAMEARPESQAPAAAPAASPTRPAPERSYPPGVRPLSLSNPVAPQQLVIGSIGALVALIGFAVVGFFVADDPVASLPHGPVVDFAAVAGIAPASTSAAPVVDFAAVAGIGDIDPTAFVSAFLGTPVLDPPTPAPVSPDQIDADDLTPTHPSE